VQPTKHTNFIDAATKTYKAQAKRIVFPGLL